MLQGKTGQTNKKDLSVTAQTRLAIHTLRPHTPQAAAPGALALPIGLLPSEHRQPRVSVHREDWPLVPPLASMQRLTLFIGTESSALLVVDRER